ncbi:Alpha/beta hydrolase family protein [Achromobacter xylosoxidans]|nr:Alpha/beta hydrolase family protein [Achromobacter xylosoxidans]
MPDAPVLLKSLRSHFLGGREAVASGLPVLRRQVVGNGAARAIDMNGSYCAGQLYVQEYRLAEPRHPHPVLLWHGGGMSGAQWESTPDGRQGWLWRLLQSGYDVFVADAPERGRASWAMYPQIYDAAPIFRSKEEAWHLFRIGPADGYAPRGQPRRAHPGQQFPADAFDTFAKQFVPRWLAHDAMALDAYSELLDLAGPCIVIGHSQGGGYATQLARECPGPIRAVVAVEPTGTPERVDGPLPPNYWCGATTSPSTTPGNATAPRPTLTGTPCGGPAGAPTCSTCPPPASPAIPISACWTATATASPNSSSTGSTASTNLRLETP